VSVVYHLAAAVQFAEPYERLRETNLVGTARVLAFARGKVLHYASTLSVGACVAPPPSRFHEKDRLDAEHVFGGYAQSKWAAEVLVEAARDDEAWTTYRLGLLTGGQLTTFVRGVARIGALPRIDDAWRLRFDVTPVEWAARALVAIARRPRASPVFHLAGPRPASLAELTLAIRGEDVPVDLVDNEAFRRRVSAAPLDHTTATAFLSLCERTTGDRQRRHAMRDLFLATDTTFDTTETERLLPDLPCPAPDLARCVREALR
jgi:thioester reductase-like protein